MTLTEVESGIDTNVEHETETDTSQDYNYNHLIISQINKNIYLGSCEHAIQNSEEFQNLKIDVIINCAVEVQYNNNTGCKVHNYKIVENNDISFMENMDDIVKKIAHYVRLGKKLYIHCVRGISRSPAILIYFFMTYKNFSYKQALKSIQRVRQGVEINEKIADVLLTIDQDLD